MSDQCDVTITFKNKRDADRFKKATGEDWNHSDTSDNGFEVDFFDCDRAMIDELWTAAEAGIEFIGTHGQGDEYPRERFVATEGEVTFVPLDNDGCETARLEVDWETGEVRPNPDDILAMHNHVAKVRRVKEGWAKWRKRAKRGKK
jgi:hypothetical protein